MRPGYYLGEERLRGKGDLRKTKGSEGYEPGISKKKKISQKKKEGKI